jgi:hypothetical protein
MPKERFDERGWVDDIIQGAITGFAVGAVGVLFVPDPPSLQLMIGGSFGGLVTGMLNLPIRWLLNRRPPALDDSHPKEGTSHGQ